MSATKEHTETISLVKSTSPFDGLEIEYEESRNNADLTISLKLMLNSRHIGTIKNSKADYHPFEFSTETPILEDYSAKTVIDLKKNIEKKLNELFLYLKTLK